MNTRVICNNCGSIDDYRTAVKSNNHVAYCNGCDKFIKNIPHETSFPVLFFGKYKGTRVDQIEDLGYLRWVWGKVKVSEYTRKAIDEQISKLNLTHI